MVIDGEVLLSQEGTTQGDPLAMPFYALATVPLLTKLSDKVDFHVSFSFFYSLSTLFNYNTLICNQLYIFKLHTKLHRSPEVLKVSSQEARLGKTKRQELQSSLPVIPEVSTQVPAIPPKGILPSNRSDSGADQDQSSDGTTSVSPKIPPQVPPRPPKGVVTADQSDNSSAPASPEVPPIPPRPSKVSDTNSIKAVADSRSL